MIIFGFFSKKQIYEEKTKETKNHSIFSNAVVYNLH